MKVTDLDDAAGLPEIGKLQSRFESAPWPPGPGLVLWNRVRLLGRLGLCH